MSRSTQLPNKPHWFFIPSLLNNVAISILSTPFILPRLLYKWSARLPRRFSCIISGIAFIYFSGATLLSAIFVGWITTILPDSAPWVLIFRITIIFVLMLVLFLVTLLFPLVMLGVVDKLLWPNPPLQEFKIHEPMLPSSGSGERNGDNQLSSYERIGIILSGGGAKGAYQAGAMKAIYEFLEEHDAHDKVKMIAATSIGSWNALFWLAGLIKGHGKDKGLLEQWWSRINIQSIIRPKRFLPLRQNHLLSNQPWRETFQAFFGDGNPKASQKLIASDIGYYFTRSNVGKGRLEFATNQSIEGSAKDRAHKIEKLEHISEAVFCSMDIPPLFEYTPGGEEQSFFEDGGVINNLPIRFGVEFEKCDLLFILPLNASFEQQVDHHSLTKRLLRVMNVRQGVLERNSFKMINLYNELAGLRKKYRREIERPLNVATGREFNAEEESARRALNRTHEVIRVFAICPAPELMIDTTEFWKTEEAKQAFQLMYKATKDELAKFKSWVEAECVQMALVKPDGTVISEDFKVRSRIPS